MNIPEMLEFIDEVVEEKTGNPLTDLQVSILEETLKGKKYVDVAQKNCFTVGHVRDVGYELWQLLSDIFDKPLNKRNLKRFLEKQNNVNCGVFNFCKGNTITYSYNEKSSDLQDIEPETKEYSKAKYQVQIKMAKKLKRKGLSDAEIAEILEIETEELEDSLQ
jgi:predicted XRE-type DNA-binding protein